MDDVAAGNTPRVTGSATVVGGGIGGLAAAVALRRTGWDVVVHERRADPAAEGSGISVWPNALRALDALGLGDAVRDAGTTQTAGGIRDRRGRWLVRTDAEALRRRHGDAIVVLARADLLAILRNALPPGVLTTGSELTAPPGTDLVVGADGIGSSLRRHVAPDARLRSTGTVAWRLTATVAPGDDPPTEGGESWGDGEYAGVAPLPATSASTAAAAAPGRVYLWVVVPESAPDDLDHLRERFAGWHDPIPTLLARVEESSVLRTALSWLPPLRTFVRGRVALLGDAAHAMTPNLGQGGGLALEDAATLGICVRPEGDVGQALARYDALRRARTARLTRMSRTAGLVAGLHGRIPTTVRDTAVRAVPSALTVRGLDGVLGWTPPTG